MQKSIPFSERLNQLAALGLPVVPGRRLDQTDEIPDALAELHQGDLANGLVLFAVRSELLHRPLLYVGMNSDATEALSREWQDAARAYAAYGRFISDYGELALGLRFELFEDELDEYKMRAGTFRDADLSAEDWRRLSDRFMSIVEQEIDEAFPQRLEDQLELMMGARRFRKHPCYLQIMLRSKEGLKVGRISTRDTFTGAPCEQILYRRTGEQDPNKTLSLPESFHLLLKDASKRVEVAFKEPQEIRFAVAGDTLWVTGCQQVKVKDTAAAVRLAVDLAREKVISRRDAIQRINPLELDTFLHPRLDPDAPFDMLTRGTPASPGAVSGRLVFDAQEAETAADRGEQVLLVCRETTPSEVFAMQKAAGIITSRGGPASHAATVARGLGRPCVVGATDIRINKEQKCIYVRDRVFNEQDLLTIDGRSGAIIEGAVPTLEPDLQGELKRLLSWADEVRDLKVLVNADTVDETKTALLLGAEGIGLCRTEHMFFGHERIITMREMIMANTAEARRIALDKILPMQQADFEAFFAELEGRTLVIRLLDPPLHEFLPTREEDFVPVAEALDIPVARLRLRAERLAESNPMLGHRGCRLGLTYPEIYDMQVRAILNALLKVRDQGGQANAQIMIPLVAWPEELARLRRRLGSLIEQAGLNVKIGTMIELPRAALLARDIAQSSDFFSFGTNDLTQTTFGISRDDAAAFLKAYEQDGLIEFDPFRSLDLQGVGSLIQTAVEKGRKQKADLEIGICGEHGGDPLSIEFCQAMGLDYVSCSPYRVPVARLSAAQAALAVEESRNLTAMDA